MAPLFSLSALSRSSKVYLTAQQFMLSAKHPRSFGAEGAASWQTSCLMPRRFPAPWKAERIPGGYVVKDASGNALAYAYGCETREQADTAKVLTMDEARRIASNITKLPTLLGATEAGN
jgi:hypothetical protein